MTDEENPRDVRLPDSSLASDSATASDSAPSARDGLIQSVRRAARLLKAVSVSAENPTLTQLALTCGLTKSTAWRLLATLESENLVDRDHRTGGYTIGIAGIAISHAATHDVLKRRARPTLRTLAEETGESVSLSSVHAMHLVFVDQVDSSQIVAPDWTGRSVPLHATSTGKAALAYLTMEDRNVLLPEPLVRFTENTITNRERLEEELGAVVTHGYSVSSNELELGLSGASACVFDSRGMPITVLSVWGPSHRVTAERLHALGRRTSQAAKELQAILSV
jgi:DNA-binding IclR family transcriptional regulator